MTSEKKKEFFRALKFLLFSISAGVIQIVSFTLLDLLTPLDYVIKSYIALTLSVLWNFTFNRKFTFKSAENVPIAMIKTLCYYAIFAPLSIRLGDMYLVKTLGWNEILIQAITMVINFVTEFLYQRFFVFGKSLDTAVKKEEEKPAEELESVSENETKNKEEK